MWHEARKHERKLRGMMVDYKKRAERRREYYEKISQRSSACTRSTLMSCTEASRDPAKMRRRSWQRRRLPSVIPTRTARWPR
ncbi:CLK4 associating serine/arginine rich protein [Homo sapiens]|uniref:CLK4 associating serine/arginine rich protein n=1 Tax=Homo sapiens TaxID=9606 RepID=K7EKR8_HUMAN|nr:CLK4 associating serine/arginine rich protein [Homo sapiens]KAI4043325.1 CLK4 associating serine/arginine rich protein [Homo sapiens]